MSCPLIWCASILSSCNVLHTCFKKLIFFREASTSTTVRFGINVLRGIPGNPPPDPISSNEMLEGIMTAAKYKLANLTVILDYNDVQLDGFVHDIMPLEPIIEKWRTFHWDVIEIDGHNMHQILDALEEVEKIHDRPTVIIARTIKGKGVPFMENRYVWHGLAPTEEQLVEAKRELREGDKL